MLVSIPSIKREKLMLIFKIWLFIYTFMGTNTFLRESFLVTLCVWPMFLFAGILCFDRIIHYKSYIKTPGILLLIAMCGSAFISMVLNYQYGLKENFINLILWCIYFSLLYTNANNRTKESIIKECEIIGWLIIIYMAVNVIAAFAMMATGYSGCKIGSDGYEGFYGFSIGRLWGMFVNLNAASVTAVIAISFSLYFIAKKNKLLLRLLLSLNCVIQICYISFSDSRIGRLCLCILFATVVLLKGYYFSKERKIFVKFLVIIAVIAVTSIAYIIPVQIKQQYNNWVMWEENNNNFSMEEDINSSSHLIERGYDLSGDVSNRRFDVWKSGLEVFLSKPLFGTSFRGVTEYSLENLPNTYIVNNDYKQLDTFDNELINILASQGIVGIIVLILFVIRVLQTIFPQLFSLKKDINFWILSFSIVLILCASAMTVSTMFYNSTPNTNCFWIFLGALVALANKNRLQNERIVKKNGKKN